MKKVCSKFKIRKYVSCNFSFFGRSFWLFFLVFLYELVCAHACTQLCSTLCDPWTVAHQAPLSMEFSQARTLEQVAISFCKGSSRPTDQTCISCILCIGRWVLYQLSHNLSISTKKRAVVLMEIVLNLSINLGKITIFTVLSLPVYEFGMFFHLFSFLSVMFYSFQCIGFAFL